MDVFGNSTGVFPENGTVSNSIPSVDDNIVVYDGTSGKELKDSGVNISSIVPLPSNVVLGTAPSVIGNIPVYLDISGYEIQDSGFSAGSFATATSLNNVELHLNGIDANINNIGTRGLSDTWTNLNPANSQSMITYAPEILTMVAFSASNGVSYSLDYGTTWTFVALGATLYIVGWSGSVFVALGAYVPSAYTSVDGITWTLRAAPPYNTAATDIGRIFYSNITNTFFSGANDASNGIMSSTNNGVTWNAVSSTRIPFKFAENDNIIVGASALGFVYSTDGISWNNTADSFSCIGVVFSSERNEFIAASNTGASTYRSVDGITWTQYTNNIPSAIVQEIIWVPSYYKYFITARDPVTLLYSLWSSTDGISPFVNNPTMSNSTAVGTLFYSLTYIQSLDRFYIISNNSPQIHYSTKSSNVSLLGNVSAGTLTPNYTTSDLGSSSYQFRDLYLSGTPYHLTPSAISIWSPDTVSIAYTAATVRLINITNFTQSLNPKNDFTATLSTGLIRYTGALTRYFYVMIHYGVSLASVANSLTHYISKNSSLVISGQRTVLTNVVTGDTRILTNCISNVVQLALNDTIQLGGLFTQTTNVSYSNVSYSIYAL